MVLLNQILSALLLFSPINAAAITLGDISVGESPVFASSTAIITSEAKISLGEYLSVSAASLKTSVSAQVNGASVVLGQSSSIIPATYSSDADPTSTVRYWNTTSSISTLSSDHYMTLISVSHRITTLRSYISFSVASSDTFSSAQDFPTSSTSTISSSTNMMTKFSQTSLNSEETTTIFKGTFSQSTTRFTGTSHSSSTSLSANDFYNSSPSNTTSSYSSKSSTSSTAMFSLNPTPTPSIASSSKIGTSTVSSTSSSFTIILTSTLSSTLSKTTRSSPSNPSKGITISQPSKNTYSGSIFRPIATDEPAALFTRNDIDLKFPDNVNTQTTNFQTNKFYTNMLLDGQNNTVWTYPYNLFYSATSGMGISITNTSKRVFDYTGSTDENVPTTFSNPTMVAALTLGSIDISSGSFLMMDNYQTMSVNATIKTENGHIEFPLVEGMGMITAIYSLSVPTISALSATIQSFKAVTSKKLIITLIDSTKWIVYSNQDVSWSLNNDKTILTANKSFANVLVQVATLSTYSDSSVDVETIYDSQAGTYINGVNLVGSTDASTIEYSFEYFVIGDATPLVFLLPHHISSLSSTTNSSNTNIHLYAATKGEMTGYQTKTVTFQESIPEFTPNWLPIPNDKNSITYSTSQVSQLQDSVVKEMNLIGFDIKSTVSGTDTYTAGKLLDKYSYMLLISHDIIGNETLTSQLLDKLTEAWGVFVSNKPLYPLSYINIGAIAVTVDSSECYGNSYMNDHHFHYGYFIHSAATIGHVAQKVDSSSTFINDVKNFVNSLLRDVANPSTDDKLFPQFRMFDWYHGHSFASGLIASGDGRNQESSSEDVNFALALKLWGKIIEDGSLESVGDLMLLVMRRSLNNYYFFGNDNTVVPENYLNHRVSGIIYENKMTYVTFFGKDIQYIHGIQMLPITPASLLIKNVGYLESEWQQMGFQQLVDGSLKNDPWGNVLGINQALFDPEKSLTRFSDSSFDIEKLDNGQSLSWSLAVSMGLSNY